MARQDSNIQRIASGSFWSGSNYLIQGVFSFIGTIIVTRYLGATRYGIFAYLLWFVGIGSTVLELGISQVFRKYVPRYVNDLDNKGLAVTLFHKILRIQMMATGILIVLFLLAHPYWGLLVKFSDPQLNVFVILAVLILMPTILLRTLTSFATSADQFRFITISTLASQSLLIAGMVMMKILNFNIIFLLLVYLVSTALGAGILAWCLRNKLNNGQQVSNKILDGKEIKRFASIAYINLLLQVVVWTQSEIFFLGKYSASSEVGYYALAFTLATVITGGIGVLQQVVTNVQLELLEKNEIVSHQVTTDATIRYFSAFFIPVALIINYFLPNIIPVVFGSDYIGIVRLFPLMMSASLVAVLLNPLGTMVVNDNKKFGITVMIGMIGAVLNIALDILLISRYAAIGAAWANFITQVLVTGIIVGYLLWATKQRLQWISLVKIVLFSCLLGLAFASYYHVGLIEKVYVALGGLTIYTLITYIFNFTRTDKELFKEIRHSVIGKRFRRV